MKIEIVDYKPEHILTIMESNPRERELYWCRTEDWDGWKYSWQERGPAYTLFADGKIVGSAGVVLMNKKSGEAWMVLSSLFYNYKKEFFRAVRDKLEDIIKDKGLVRVQAMVVTDFPEAEHWLRHLGFENETPNPRGARRVGPNGEDMYLYARECR
jgi:hypothetical protein